MLARVLERRIQIGDGIQGAAFLEMGTVATEADNQIPATATLTFTGSNNKWGYFKLLGSAQTVANIVETTPGFGVIEAAEAEVNTRLSTLTLNNSTQINYAGYLRDTNGGANNTTVRGLSVIAQGSAPLQLSLAAGAPAGAATGEQNSFLTILAGAKIVTASKKQRARSPNSHCSPSTPKRPPPGCSICTDFNESIERAGKQQHRIRPISAPLSNSAVRLTTLTMGANNTQINNAGGQTQTFNGLIKDNAGTGGTLTLAKTGSGTEVLTGANTYSGSTQFLGGFISAATIEPFTASSNVGLNSVFTFNGGGLLYSGATVSTTHTGTFAANGGTISVVNTLTFVNALTATAPGGTLHKQGNGTLDLAGSADNALLLLDSQTGLTLLDKQPSSSTAHVVTGTRTDHRDRRHRPELAGTGGDQISDAAAPSGGLTINAGGIFDLNANSEAVDRLNGAGMVTNTAVGNSTLTVGQSGGTSTFGGTLADGGSGKTLALKKTGAGILTLVANVVSNTHSNGTVVSAGGTLALRRIVRRANPLGSGLLTLSKQNVSRWRAGPRAGRTVTNLASGDSTR